MNKLFFILVLCLFLSLTTGCERKQPNVILITVDTLSADHLHSYGYERNTSPTLDRLAGEGVLFENASVACTRTTQSLASLMTGRYPQTIGVRALHEKLNTDELTLAEIFKQYGYRTGGVSANPVIMNGNFDQGFDFFFVAPKKMTAEPLTDKILPWLKQNRDQPVFAWVHYLDPHMPYKPPKQFIDIFDPGYEGRFQEEFKFFYHPNREIKRKHELFKGNVVFNRTKFSQQDLRRIKVLYDSEIAYVDNIIEKLLGEMAELGIMDNTLLIISADHGESLGEHQYFAAHGDFVYENIARVPLIFHWPGHISSGRRISQSVRTIDIFPTVLSLLGITDPFNGREGKDLTGVVLGRQIIEDLPVYTEGGECQFPRFNDRRYIKGVKGKVRGLKEKNWKLILTPTKSKPIFELYNLDSDPKELINLADKEQERVRKMAQKLEAWMKKGMDHVIPAENIKQKRRLRALGYIQ